jgi:hypothetical protein
LKSSNSISKNKGFFRIRTYGLAHPIPAGIFVNPEIPSKNIHAVKTNGPVNAGKPHVPKIRCRAGITKQHETVAKTAIIKA